jgi:hypothetical protein
MRRRGLSERMGGWSTRHEKVATLLWVGFVVASFAGGSLVRQNGLSDSRSADGQTARAERIIDSARFPQTAAESVLVESGSATSADASFRSVVARVVATVSADRYVAVAAVRCASREDSVVGVRQVGISDRPPGGRAYDDFHC